MASYLNPDPDAPLFGVSALKLWLKGDITTPNFLSSNNGSYADKGGRDGFSIQELHRALYLAILEISLKLDPELECAATQAAGGKYCITVDVDEFYQGRDVEVKSLVDLDPDKRDEIISTYDRDAVCEVLMQTQGEIGWLESQGRRLEVHMEIAEEMLKLRLRKAFFFRPLPRSWAVSRIDQDVDMLNVDAVEAEIDEEEVGEEDVVEDEIDEEEVEETMEVDDEMEGGQVNGEKKATEMEGGQVNGEKKATETQERRLRKERLELFKREVDVGFGTGMIEQNLEEIVLKEKNDSPLVGLGVKENGES